MKKPHKHAELIKAWADGAEIEYWSPTSGAWEECVSISTVWHIDYKYRIKPEPKPDVVKYFYGEVHPMIGLRFSECHDVMGKELALTFDGETGKLKKAEVL